MTKEELLQDERIFSAANGDVSYIPLHSLDKFFSQNVVIPKGKNRHPYADVLHEWAENPNQPIQFLDSWGQWCDLGLSNTDQYRIKPSEPVYEWLFYKSSGETRWFTMYELSQEVCLESWHKAEETKRERKQ